MIEVDVQLDKEQIKDVLSYFDFVGGNTRLATQLAINASLTPARRVAKDEITDRVKIPAREITSNTKGLKIIKAYKDQPIPTGRIRASSGRPYLLTRYSTDAAIRSAGTTDGTLMAEPPPVPKGGIRVKVDPNKSPQIVQGHPLTVGKPFYMILRNSGTLGIVGRRKVPGPRGGMIFVMHSTDISQVFFQVKEDIAPEAGTIFTNKMVEKINYLLAKKYPPEG